MRRWHQGVTSCEQHGGWQWGWCYAGWPTSARNMFPAVDRSVPVAAVMVQAALDRSHCGRSPFGLRVGSRALIARHTTDRR